MALRCSKCSSLVKPIVAIDVDGTLAEYHEPLAEFASLYFSRGCPSGWDGRGEMEDFLGLTKGEWRDLKFAYRSGGFKRFAPIYPGAADFTRAAWGLGCEIWITTTRPWLRLDSIDPDTRWWLDHNKIAFDHLIYDEHKYKLLGELVEPERVVMVVDDLDDTLTEAVDVFGPGVDYMIARSHNSQGRRQGYDFNELKTMLAMRVKEWKVAWQES